MASMKDVENYIKDNITEICEEHLELCKSGILRDGKMRYAASALRDSLSIEGGTAMNVVNSILLSELARQKVYNS